jgi:hypothetical protein
MVPVLQDEIWRTGNVIVLCPMLGEMTQSARNGLVVIPLPRLYQRRLYHLQHLALTAAAAGGVLCACLYACNPFTRRPARLYVLRNTEMLIVLTEYKEQNRTMMQTPKSHYRCQTLVPAEQARDESNVNGQDPDNHHQNPVGCGIVPDGCVSADQLASSLVMAALRLALHIWEPESGVREVACEEPRSPHATGATSVKLKTSLSTVSKA